MIKPILLLIIFIFAIDTFGASQSQRSIVELSPLRSALGIIAVRSERESDTDFAFGFSYDRIVTKGNLQKNEDQIHELSGELLYYPGEKDLGFFLGLGVQYRNSRLNFQRPRNYTSDVQHRSDSYDYWVLEEHRVGVPVVSGYRAQFYKIFTASIRYSFYESLYQSGSIVEEDIKSYDLNPKNESRPQRHSRISIYLGLIIP